MTPKKKAKELLNKYLFSNVIDEYVLLSGARKCALIAVDEIIKAIDWHEFETPNKELEYWNKVKQEIENL